ncbi:MAG TPA: AraC family transcriptional regulator [Chloroflexota bacterium]|jgi:AraC-like DNA-binding protein/mannose-6-phosphate isomerase-like protein (cupin superfamily)
MVRRLNGLPDDALTELLRAVKVHSTVYCVSELSAPWGFRVEDSSVAKFHLVLEGSCILSLESGEQLALLCGDMVLLPAGTGHAVRDRLDSKVQWLDRILAEYRADDDASLIYGGSGTPTRLVCGGFVLADGLPGGLLGLLPRVLRLDAGASGVQRWLEPVFELLRDEVDGSRPGTGAVLAKLADVFLTQVLRTYLVGAEAAGIVHADSFRDPGIARALELVHAQPDRAWTVAGLAGEVGMSRTLFATRFRALVGESPIRYLARVRLSQAAGYLTTTNATLYSIAQSTGYDSEASLSKAFKRAFGQSPREYRRESASRPIRIATQHSAPS